MRDYKVVKKNGELLFHRLTFDERIQHVVMFLSFTILAVTGLPMKYYHTEWAQFLYRIMGGIAWVPIVHRVNAIVMTAVFVYHVFYLSVNSWRHHLKPLKDSGQMTLKNTVIALLGLPMVPNLTDLKELIATLKYWLFLTNERPAMVEHGLKEKFGYLAVFWGVPVIGFSGYLLWGESIITKYVPGIVLNFAYIVHSDEALLASIVIFGWHLYNTHMAPAAFPMGKAWITGYLSEREMLEDHYIAYCEAMERSGLGHRIRQNRPDAGFTTGKWQRRFEKARLVTMIVFFSFATVYVCRFIVITVFGSHHAEASHDNATGASERSKFLEELILENTNDKTFYRGFRLTAEKEIKKHYHRIELKFTPDDKSHCIRCHGDFPHGSSKKQRSFLNMHALYFACQTCHMRPEKDEELQYFWYNREGDVVVTPQINIYPADHLGLKLMPRHTGLDAQPIKDVEAEIDFAIEFLKELKNGTLNMDEKQKALKQIHKNKPEEPVGCAECHNKTNPFISFKRAGYSSQRAKELLSDDITNMINKYKEFFLPSFVKIKGNM